MWYIEVHKQLFPPESEEYGDWNQFFRNMYECTIEVPIQGKLITTLEYTDHFFYLVCHALKHFLHSGFGVRQVCDMVMFANTYGERLDWEKILKNCRAIHAERFVAALLQIGKNYLNFQPEKACYPEQWRRIHVDETNLLEDLLSGGVYGGASMSRKHSSRITLHAVRAQKKGSRKQAFRNSVWHTVFPSAGALKHEYLYLRKYPFLLPVAWVSRLWKYGKENRRESDNQAAESIRIGRQRVQLMKQYGLIPENQEHARK